MNEYGGTILSQEEVSTLSLEDRREARREKAVRFVQRNPGAREAFYKGVAQYDKRWGRAKVLPWHQSMTRPGDTNIVAGRKLRKGEREVLTTWSNVPTIRKRTLDERVQSMVFRLKKAPLALQERYIKEICAEYWKEGSPVSEEALKAVAAHYLNVGSGNKVRLAGQLGATRTKDTLGG
jgi:16S rRNA G1207 methylase RsmC